LCPLQIDRRVHLPRLRRAAVITHTRHMGRPLRVDCVEKLGRLS
jgi:hypothetical protein